MKERSRIGILSIIAIMITMILGGCQNAQTQLSDKFQEETVKAEAMKSIELFNKRDYQGILDMGAPEFQQAITVEAFAEQCDPYLDKDGAFKEISKTVVLGNEDKETGETYGGVVMVGKYENGKIQFTIGFNEDMELMQFIIR